MYELKRKRGSGPISMSRSFRNLSVWGNHNVKVRLPNPPLKYSQSTTETSEDIETRLFVQLERSQRIQISEKGVCEADGYIDR